MAGINGLAEGFRADNNLRINKFACLVKSNVNASTRVLKYAALPGAWSNTPTGGPAGTPQGQGANAQGFLGALIDHFVEPNYFVPQGTVSTTVTGTTPTLYNLQGKGMTLQVNGKARGICASAVNQGDELIIADQYGRLQTNNIAAGNVAYVVGIAEHGTVSPEDIVEFLVQPYAKKM